MARLAQEKRFRDHETYDGVTDSAVPESCLSEEVLIKYVARSYDKESVHEAGAIEFGGHKVLTLPHADGKLTAESVGQYLAEYYGDANREHIVMPVMS